MREDEIKFLILMFITPILSESKQRCKFLFKNIINIISFKLFRENNNKVKKK